MQSIFNFLIQYLSQVEWQVWFVPAGLTCRVFNWCLRGSWIGQRPGCLVMISLRHCEYRKKLPWEHLISYQGVNLFYLNMSLLLLSLLVLSLLSLLLLTQFMLFSCHNLIFSLFLSQFELLSSFTIWDFELSYFYFWVFSQFKFLSCVTHWVWVNFFCFSFVTIWVFEFCHNSSCWVLSQFEFLSFVTIWVFHFCQNLCFWV